MTDFETTQWAVEDWAEARNIIHGSTPAAQVLKLTEEMGELAGAIAKDKSMDEVADALGDILVVLTIIARQKRLDLAKCFKGAYDEIKDRKGKMIKGVFIKESDLTPNLEKLK
jgi:NTP pyrophosphatase (non-canonical NTP hydrolase)